MSRYPFLHQIMTSAGLATRIGVVGNGPIEANLCESIDHYDIVIRFNSCQNYGNTGRRTDVLVLVNTGPAGKMLACQNEAINEEALFSAKKIWIAKEPSLIAAQRLKYPKDAELWEDYSDELINNKLRSKTWQFLSPRVYHSAIHSLKKYGANDQHDPSTGILAIFNIYHTLSTMFSPCVLTLFGFTHQGWIGHPWDAERALIDAQSNWIKRA